MDENLPKLAPMPPADVIMLRLLQAARESTAASLAGGMIAGSGRAYTVEEAISLQEEVFRSLFPNLARPPSRLAPAQPNATREGIDNSG